MTEFRKVEVLKKGEWKTVRLKEVKKGDRFRLFEPDGTPVLDNKQRAEMIACKDAYLDGELWTVAADYDE